MKQLAWTHVPISMEVEDFDKLRKEAEAHDMTLSNWIIHRLKQADGMEEYISQKRKDDKWWDGIRDSLTTPITPAMIADWAKGEEEVAARVKEAKLKRRGKP